MKALCISLVAALGLAIGLWWTRGTAPVTETRTAPVTERRTPSTPLARIPALRPTIPIKTLEPTSTDPEKRPHQEALWRDLRSFATEKKLTDAQWERFQRDLSELAAIESAAWAQGVRTDGFDGIVELSEELEAELLARCAAYMTRDQIAGLRFRFLDLVTRVRRLHYVPTIGPEPST